MPKQEHYEYECEKESREFSPALNILPVERKEHGEEIDEDMPAMIFRGAHYELASIAVFCRDFLTSE